jgi:hypothetical protein
MTPVTVWTSTTYHTRWSRRVQGVLRVEGTTRADARSLLRELATSNAGAAASHARRALSGSYRATLVRCCEQRAYAASDGTWRGWDAAAWQTTPPAAYARWRGLTY